MKRAYSESIGPSINAFACDRCRAYVHSHTHTHTHIQKKVLTFFSALHIENTRFVVERYRVAKDAGTLVLVAFIAKRGRGEK